MEKQKERDYFSMKTEVTLSTWSAGRRQRNLLSDIHHQEEVTAGLKAKACDMVGM